MSDFTDQFSELCQMTVIWEHLIGRSTDGNGQRIFDAPVTFSPDNNQGGYRVFETVRQSSGPNGQAVNFLEGSTIYLLAAPDIGLDDQLYIEGDAAPYPPILRRAKYADETGIDQFIVVTMGSANG